MSIEQQSNFSSIVKDITDNKHFNLLNTELHHGITRYQHSMRVAVWTYKIGNKLHLKNIEDVTRAALLHDFYVNDDLVTDNSAKALREHPSVALTNSKKYFDINKTQEDIIVNHMFPCTLTMPKTKEGWLVSGVDKIVGTYEMLRFKTSLYLGIYLLFMFELIKISR